MKDQVNEETVLPAIVCRLGSRSVGSMVDAIDITAGFKDKLPDVSAFPSSV